MIDPSASSNGLARKRTVEFCPSMFGRLTSISIGSDESMAWRQSNSALERSSGWALAHGARPTGTGPPKSASSRNRESAEVSRPEASVSKSPIWVVGVDELISQFGRLWQSQRGGWSTPTHPTPPAPAPAQIRHFGISLPLRGSDIPKWVNMDVRGRGFRSWRRLRPAASS